MTQDDPELLKVFLTRLHLCLIFNSSSFFEFKPQPRCLDHSPKACLGPAQNPSMSCPAPGRVRHDPATTLNCPVNPRQSRHYPTLCLESSSAKTLPYSCTLLSRRHCPQLSLTAAASPLQVAALPVLQHPAAGHLLHLERQQRIRAVGGWGPLLRPGPAWRGAPGADPPAAAATHDASVV